LRKHWLLQDSDSHKLTDSGSCGLLVSGSFRLEDDDGGSYWLMNSGGSLMLLLADLERLGERADEGLEVAVLDGLLAVSPHHCEHSLALTGEQLCDNSR
jgi:hypothetical protein